MKRKSGFSNFPGTGVEDPTYYYGPFMPGAQPANAVPVSTAPQPVPATPADKAKNGWLTNENKQALFSTGLGLASQFFQTKMGGGQNTQVTPEPEQEKTGTSSLLVIGGSLLALTVIGVIIYKIAK